MEWVLINVAVVAALGGGALGWIVGRWYGGALASVLALALLVGAVAALGLGSAEAGYDAMGYVIGGILLLAPASLGAAVGGWIGTRQRARRKGAPRE